MNAYVLAQIKIETADECGLCLAGFMPIVERLGGELPATSKNETRAVEGIARARRGNGQAIITR